MAYLSVSVPITSPVVSPRGGAHENEYFYTLVFPNTKPSDLDASQHNEGSDDRISYCDALATLRSVTGGGKEREARVVDEFREAWMAKFRTPAPAAHDTIPLFYFLELVRELIVQRFDGIPDLFLKTSLSDDQQSLLISFRPSITLLSRTADRVGMRVAIMSEIDPGEQYWSVEPTRASNESYQWSKPDAQEELYRMFLAGKISSEEAQVFDDTSDREDAGMWSRRIHALRRCFDPEVSKIVSHLDQSQLTTTYLPFKNRASLRYLYRQIDGGRDDATPFRVVDKIRLTKAIIDAEFDCDALVEKRLLSHHCCLHTHHTDAVDTSIDVLRAQWGSVTSPIKLYRQGLITLSELFHYQPIPHIRNYFGEEFALYCAYTSFYANALQWHCISAVTAAILHSCGVWNGLPPNIYYVVFAIANTTFVHVLVRKWEIKEKLYACEWGVNCIQDTNVARPQFRGEMAISVITHRLEPFYSPRRRHLQQVCSWFALLAISIGLLCADYLLLLSTYYTEITRSSVIATNMVITIIIKLLSVPIAVVSKALNEWENYRTQQDYDFNLTLKFGVVQTVNAFGFLWLQTFLFPFVSPSTTDHESARQLLITMLSVDLAASIWELRGSLLSCFHAWVRRGFFRRCGSVNNHPDDQAHLLRSLAPSTNFVELSLDPYEGVMFDFAQVMITFGFVAWFSALAPLATLLAWAIAITQIRVDAFKLCELTQRPFPSQKSSIGSWLTYLRFLAFGSWIQSAMISTLYLCDASSEGLRSLKNFILLTDVTSSDAGEADRLTTETKLLAVFGGFCIVALLASVHDHDDRARLKHLRWFNLRQQFLENKYIKNLDRVPDSIREGLPPGRVFLNGVHLYIVTGNKAEEDAAEEILDELVDLQLRSLQLQRQITELQAVEATVGKLVVEVGSINNLPVMDALTKAVDTFLQLQLIQTDTGDESSGRNIKRTNDKPVNTSVIKKNRSPSWTETFELSLRSLEDTLLIRVFDWELLGKNRRIGQTTLSTPDILSTAPPLLAQASTGILSGSTVDPPVPESRDEALSITSQATTAPALSTSISPMLATPSPPHSPKVRMATFETVIEMPDVLLSTMHADLVKHGHPKLSLRCGVQLDTLGRLMLQLRTLQSKIHQLKDKEKQFFQWK